MIGVNKMTTNSYRHSLLVSQAVDKKNRKEGRKEKNRRKEIELQ